MWLVQYSFLNKGTCSISVTKNQNLTAKARNSKPKPQFNLFPTSTRGMRSEKRPKRLKTHAKRTVTQAYETNTSTLSNETL